VRVYGGERIDSSSDAEEPKIADLTNGGYVVVWSAQTFPDGMYDIHFQRFDGDGARVGAEEVVNTTTLSLQAHPQVTALAGGGYVVAWDSFNPVEERDHIFAQVFAANGAKLGSEIDVGTTVQTYDHGAQIAALADGGFAIVR
jgi:hypothetical protein